jgi:hypothetical protein
MLQSKGYVERLQNKNPKYFANGHFKKCKHPSSHVVD